MTGVLATLQVIDTIAPSQVTIVRTLDDGRCVVRFAGGEEWTVPEHTLVAQHRGSDAETSRAAAARQTGHHLGDFQFKVLAALAAAGPYGLTDHEHLERNGIEQDSAGKRRLELQRRGLVRDTGDTRETTRNGRAKVWQITSAGEEFLAHARAERRLGHLPGGAA